MCSTGVAIASLALLLGLARRPIRDPCAAGLPARDPTSGRQRGHLRVSGEDLGAMRGLDSLFRAARVWWPDVGTDVGRLAGIRNGRHSDTLLITSYYALPLLTF